MLNSIFVSRARERFRVPRSYVAVGRPESGLAPELVGNEQAVVLFDGTHDVGRWEVRDRHGEIDVEHWEYIGLADRSSDVAGAENDDERPEPGSKLFVILMIRRGSKAMIMQQGMKLKAGDVASVAIHSAEVEAAHAALADLGWSRTKSTPSNDAEALVAKPPKRG
jgi:hypothetical protein